MIARVRVCAPSKSLSVEQSKDRVSRELSLPTNACPLTATSVGPAWRHISERYNSTTASFIAIGLNRIDGLFDIRKE